MNRFHSILYSIMAGILLSSCHPSLYKMTYRPEGNLGTTQKESRRQQIQPVESIPTLTPQEVTIEPIEWEVEDSPNFSSWDVKEVVKEKPKARKGHSKPTWKETLGISSQAKKKPTQKERRPFFRSNNDGFWIGGGLLGIAMLLTILNFPSLALLFGLVSLLFFIFAIKKALRRNRRRQRFKGRQRK